MYMENCKVLVADDEIVIADTLATILRRNGFIALAVYSGEEALDCCLAYNPDLFLSDVVMGGMDGIRTAIRMRELFPDLRVLLFSGHASTADLLDEAKSRGYEFETLSKPVHPKDLLAKLHEEPARPQLDAQTIAASVIHLRATE
jgi:CheY-like chemotaxis protein